MALTVSLPIGCTITQTSTLDIAAGAAPIAFLANYFFSTGTSAYQGNTFVSDNRVLGAAAVDTFDLAGGVVDIFGNVVTFTRIRVIMVETSASAAGDLVLFSTSGNDFIGPFFTPGQEVLVRPFCCWIGVAPAEDGWPVIAGTADLFRIRNASGGNISYNIIIIGTT